jgi:hypothetical protein
MPDYDAQRNVLQRRQKDDTSKTCRTTTKFEKGPRGFTEKEEKRFWDKVDVRSENECWLWTACIIPNGYGYMGFRGKCIYAHRFSAILFFGLKAEKLCVLHRCDVKRCVNPNHLFLGTPADNRKDSANKGRTCFGERHWNRRLSFEQVQEIFKMRKMKIPYRVISERFGVHLQHVYAIVSKKRWGRAFI